MAKVDCKAHPDEKGIETSNSRMSLLDHRHIARPIPTKRELKLVAERMGAINDALIARPIPTKRELKHEW